MALPGNKSVFAPATVLARSDKMYHHKALLCPTTSSPRDIVVPIKSLGLEGQAELQRIFGAPYNDLRILLIWQDGAAGQGSHTSLGIIYRDWQGLEARTLINRHAPHIQVPVPAAEARSVCRTVLSLFRSCRCCRREASRNGTSWRLI